MAATPPFLVLSLSLFPYSFPLCYPKYPALITSQSSQIYRHLFEELGYHFSEIGFRSVFILSWWSSIFFQSCWFLKNQFIKVTVSILSLYSRNYPLFVETKLCATVMTLITSASFPLCGHFIHFLGTMKSGFGKDEKPKPFGRMVHVLYCAFWALLGLIVNTFGLCFGSWKLGFLGFGCVCLWQCVKTDSRVWKSVGTFEVSLDDSSSFLIKDAASLFIPIPSWSPLQTYTLITVFIIFYLEIAVAATVVSFWKGEVISGFGQYILIYSNFQAEIKAIRGDLCFVSDSASQCIMIETNAAADLQPIQSPSTYCSLKSMSILEDFKSMARSLTQFIYHGIRRTANKSIVWIARAFSRLLLSLIGVCYLSLVFYFVLFSCNLFGFLGSAGMEFFPLG